jgi:putative FmdB family regulatory protein
MCYNVLVSESWRKTMPIYEYECQSCGDRFESFRGITERDDKVKCPNCGGQNSKKVVSSFFGGGGSSGGGCAPSFGGG